MPPSLLRPPAGPGSKLQVPEETTKTERLWASVNVKPERTGKKGLLVSGQNTSQQWKWCLWGDFETLRWWSSHQY
ncbi:hypothetical protein BaRGS_00019829 [Batillaria attramentaria]|uniref:Uncharacterized protein n=1 Tax=Batillaria attramentaria TaxID=370345 RepID=A0ABD0KP20_9CAEN